MKIIFLITLLINSVSYAVTTLHCEYGLTPQATILISETEIQNETEIGQYTEARYQGSPNQKLENIVLKTEGNELYKFQLDLGSGDKNFLITVFKSEIHIFKSTVLNPKSAFIQKMNGECVFK